MKYQPITCIWEVTMGCNMRCGHCGSSCKEPLPDELNTEEALDVCDQIAELLVKWITISGGEPLTRKDVDQLVKRLHQKNVSVNMITNGWLLTEQMAEKLKDSGIATVAISMDGTREIHDSIRKKGAFEHAEQAFATLNRHGITTGAVTTVTKQNIFILDELKEELIRMGVSSWQVQIGLPMGNLKEKPDWVIDPEQINDIINFCYKTAKEGRIRIYPADCIGYYTEKEMETKRISFQSDQVSLWDGCNAGIRGFGILHNGEILGCTSIRDREFIEGSLRERKLREIWEDDSKFLWRRNMSRDKLTGECKTCRYGSKCLGGCPNTRLTMNGNINTENRYCAYNLLMKKLENKYAQEKDTEVLLKTGLLFVRHEEYQEAIYAFKQLLRLKPDHAEGLKAKGYCEYMCGNYELCREDNKKAWVINHNDAFALRGFAIAQHRLGEKEEGLMNMERAWRLSGGNPELLYDFESMKANS